MGVAIVPDTLRAAAFLNGFRHRWELHRPDYAFNGDAGFELYGDVGAVWAYGGFLWMGVWAREEAAFANRVRLVMKKFGVGRSGIRVEPDRRYAFFKIDRSHLLEAAEFIGSTKYVGQDKVNGTGSLSPHTGEVREG